jgi:hypothetical protein
MTFELVNLPSQLLGGNNVWAGTNSYTKAVEISGVTTNGSSVYAGSSSSAAQRLVIAANDNSTGKAGDTLLLYANQAETTYIQIEYLAAGGADRIFFYTSGNQNFVIGTPSLPNSVWTANNMLDDGVNGNMITIGSISAGNAGLNTIASHLWSGTGVPNASLGVAGDYYLRVDGGAGTHLYFNAAGTWTGIV